MVYELDMPTELAVVYLVFHNSMLKKYIVYLTSIVPLENVILKDSLTFKDILVKIFHRQV